MLRGSCWMVVLMSTLLVACRAEREPAPETAAPVVYTIVITEAGDTKILAMKAVREVTGLGLRQAKDLVDGVPSVIMEDVSAEEAERIAGHLRSAGVTVELRPQ